MPAALIRPQSAYASLCTEMDSGSLLYNVLFRYGFCNFTHKLLIRSNKEILTAKKKTS